MNCWHCTSHLFSRSLSCLEPLVVGQKLPLRCNACSKCANRLSVVLLPAISLQVSAHITAGAMGKKATFCLIQELEGQSGHYE